MGCVLYSLYIGYIVNLEHTWNTKQFSTHSFAHGIRALRLSAISSLSISVCLLQSQPLQFRRNRSQPSPSNPAIDISAITITINFVAIAVSLACVVSASHHCRPKHHASSHRPSKITISRPKLFPLLFFSLCRGIFFPHSETLKCLMKSLLKMVGPYLKKYWASLK